MRHFPTGAAALLLAAACSAPPQGTARVEVDLPEQGQRLKGDPVTTALIHGDDAVTVNLIKLSGDVAMHRHEECEEVVYLLAGEGMLHLADSQRSLRAGDFVVVPRNTPHGFTPTGPEPTVILQMFVPHFVEGDRRFEKPAK
jgi:mannose-6-phosphate isomerase-like protein (cupin superfamily)